MGWGARKELRYEDRVEFSEEQMDYFGMPKMTFHYELTDRDHQALAAAMKAQARAAAALGDYMLGDKPHLIPAGSSLHYQGTVRMGERGDDRSVCDSYSQVWGIQNLFVGGNGVIPTATTGNPLLTSVALAVRSCERVTSLFD
jgi:pyranose oxidase